MGGRDFWGGREKKADCSSQCQKGEKVSGVGKVSSSVDGKLQCGPMSSEVKGNAPDRPRVSYDSQIQKCRVKLGDLMGG